MRTSEAKAAYRPPNTPLEKVGENNVLTDARLSPRKGPKPQRGPSVLRTPCLGIRKIVAAPPLEHQRSD